MIRPHLSSALLFTAALTAGQALAQTSNFRSMDVPAGKVARLAVVTALKKDCTAGQIGGVRVVTIPKNGNLSLKRGKLKTPASFRCPNVQTDAEAVFYQPKPNFKGDDEVVYETKNAEGGIERYTVKITVGDKAAATPEKDKKSDQLEL